MKFADATGSRAASKARGSGGLRHRRAAREARLVGAGPRAWPLRDVVGPTAGAVALEGRNVKRSTRRRRRRAAASFATRIKEMRDSLGKDATIDADMLHSITKAVNDHNRAAFDGSHATTAATRRSVVRRDRGMHELPIPGRERSGTRTATRTPTRRCQPVQGVQPRMRRVSRDRRPAAWEAARSRMSTGWEDVQCEVCHGPGSKHVRQPVGDKDAHRRAARGLALSRTATTRRTSRISTPVAKMKDILGSRPRNAAVTAPGSTCMGERANRDGAHGGRASSCRPCRMRGME